MYYTMTNLNPKASTMNALLRFLSQHDTEWFIGDDGNVYIVSHGWNRDGTWFTELDMVTSVKDARFVLGY